MLHRSLLALACLATPALAQSPSAAPQGPQGAIIRGLCQPDGCDEFAIVNVQTLQTNLEGSLKRTRLKTYHSSSAGREERMEESGYVYCSPTKPAVIAERDGKAVAFFLAPYATEDSRETVRKFTNFIATYFAICHGPEAGRAATRDLRGTAGRFGYQVAATSSLVAQIKRPEDVISADALPTARAAPRPPEPPAAERLPRDPYLDRPDPTYRTPYGERPGYAERPVYRDGYADAPGYRYSGRPGDEDIDLLPPGRIPEE